METKVLIQRINRTVLVIFFLVAGINHFLNPEFYLPLIPAYFPYPKVINILSALAEIILALAYIYKGTRKFIAILLMIMLVAFIPSHVYFIEQGSCIEGTLCVPAWVGIFRLIVIHPLLLAWAYYSR